MTHTEPHRLSAAAVLRRYKDEDLPAFAGMTLTQVNQSGIFGERPLDVAAIRGIEDEVSALIEGGAEINAAGELGNTALHEAAAQGHFGVVKLLLEAGANPELRNESGDTAVQLAKSNKHWQIANLLEAAMR